MWTRVPTTMLCAVVARAEIAASPATRPAAKPGAADLQITVYVRDADLTTEQDLNAVIEVENRGGSAVKIEEDVSPDRATYANARPGVLTRAERVRDKSPVVFLKLRATIPADKDKLLVYHSGPMTARVRAIPPGERAFLKAVLPRAFLAEGKCRIEAWAWPPEGDFIFSQACFVNVAAAGNAPKR